MENLDDFMESLLQEKKIDVEGDVREQLKQDMTQRLLNQIDRATLDALTDEQAAELSEKLDDPNFGEDQVADFMNECGVDTQKIALETMIIFRSLYLGGGANDQPIEENVAEAATQE